MRLNQCQDSRVGARGRGAARFEVKKPEPPEEPEAVFAFTPSAPQVDEPVQFGDESMKGDGEITVRRWDFGDGVILDNAIDPVHTFTRPGAYTVTFTLTDANGLTDQFDQTIKVAKPEKPDDSPVQDRLDAIDAKLSLILGHLGL